MYASTSISTSSTDPAGLAAARAESDGLYCAALRLFWRSVLAGRLGRLRSLLAGRSHALRSLAAAGHPGGGHYIGVYTVALREIRGSEGRVKDFDADFRPLRGHLKERWARVALARLKGIPLPPVELIRAGNEYYVRDGHHRVSVARALGEEYVDAEVTVLA